MNSRIQTIAAGIAIAAAAFLANMPATASAQPGPADPSPAPQPAASNKSPQAAASVNYETMGKVFQDRDLTTTINFKSGHPTYNVNLSALNGNGKTPLYNVTMYQGNKVVWSEPNQQYGRTYSVGSNVTKIVMTRTTFTASPNASNYVVRR